MSELCCRLCLLLLPRVLSFGCDTLVVLSFGCDTLVVLGGGCDTLVVLGGG